jgi:hypothetical protein
VIHQDTSGDTSYFNRKVNRTARTTQALAEHSNSPTGYEPRTRHDKRLSYGLSVKYSRCTSRLLSSAGLPSASHCPTSFPCPPSSLLVTFTTSQCDCRLSPGMMQRRCPHSLGAYVWDSHWQAWPALCRAWWQHCWYVLWNDDCSHRWRHEYRALPCRCAADHVPRRTKLHVATRIYSETWQK